MRLVTDVCVCLWGGRDRDTERTKRKIGRFPATVVDEPVLLSSHPSLLLCLLFFLHYLNSDNSKSPASCKRHGFG